MARELSAHNKSVLAELEEGDMVEFPRGMFSHWGIYVGNGRVVHLTVVDEGIGRNSAPAKMLSSCGKVADKGYVKEEEFAKVAYRSETRKNNDKDSSCQPLPTREIVRRARQKLGKVGYNILWKNCEHFAAFCRYDVNWSEQADKALTAFSVAGVAAVGAGLAGAYVARRERYEL